MDLENRELIIGILKMVMAFSTNSMSSDLIMEYSQAYAKFNADWFKYMYMRCEPEMAFKLTQFFIEGLNVILQIHNDNTFKSKPEDVKILKNHRTELIRTFAMESLCDDRRLSREVIQNRFVGIKEAFPKMFDRLLFDDQLDADRWYPMLDGFVSFMFSWTTHLGINVMGEDDQTLLNYYASMLLLRPKVERRANDCARIQKYLELLDQYFEHGIKIGYYRESSFDEEDIVELATCIHDQSSLFVDTGLIDTILKC